MSTPRPALHPAAAYENAHQIARDLLQDLHAQLDAMLRPDDANLRWRNVRLMNQLNATLSEAADIADNINMRNR